MPSAIGPAPHHSLRDLAHSWLLAQKAVVSVISGATSAEQVRANAAAANWQLSADELGEIDAIAPRSERGADA